MDLSPELELALVLALSCACAALGYRLARHHPSRKAHLALAGFALLGWPVLVQLFPYRLYFLYPAMRFADVLFASGFFVCGVLAGGFHDTALRRVLQGVLFAVIAYFVLAGPAWFAVNHARIAALASNDVSGVVIQSDYYSCVPAAFATVMRRWGYAIREGEAAFAMRTTFQGTSLVRIPGAARRFGSDRRLDARILDTTLEELARLDRPAILLGYAGSIRHAYALLALDANNALVGDPLTGPLVVDRSKLIDRLRWTGQAVVIDSLTAAAAAPRLSQASH